jgi:hypothetical protein
MAPERIVVARRLIDASVALIKSQEDYVLTLNRAGMYLPAMLAVELLLIMRTTLAFREARLQAMQPKRVAACVFRDISGRHSEIMSATDPDPISAIPISSPPPLRGWCCPTAGQVSGLPFRHGERGTDVGRESVDQTSAGDPAAEV